MIEKNIIELKIMLGLFVAKKPMNVYNRPVIIPENIFILIIGVIESFIPHISFFIFTL